MKTFIRYVKVIFASFVVASVTFVAITMVQYFFRDDNSVGLFWEKYLMPGILILTVCWIPLVNKKLK